MTVLKGRKDTMIRKINIETHVEDFGNTAGPVQVFILKIPLINLVELEVNAANIIDTTETDSVSTILKKLSLMVKEIERREEK